MRPDGKDAVIRTLKKHVQHDFLVKSVTLLSTGEALPFTRDGEALRIHAETQPDGNPVCFRVEIG